MPDENQDFSQIVVTTPPKPAGEEVLDVSFFYFNLATQMAQVEAKGQDPRRTIEKITEGPLLLKVPKEDVLTIKAIIKRLASEQRPDLRFQ